MTTQARQPKGIPVGGQFVASTRNEAEVRLASPDVDSEGFTTRYGAVTHADRQWATVRTKNGGEVSGYISTEGATYPMDVTLADGRVIGISGWRVKDVRFEDEPEPQEPDPADAWVEHLSSVGLHIGEWAELGDTRVRVVEDSPGDREPIKPATDEVPAESLPEPAVTQPLLTDIQVRATNPSAGEPVPGEPGWHYPRTNTKGRIPVPAGAASNGQGRGRFASVMARQFANLQGDLAAVWKDAGNLLDEATPQIR